MGYTVAQKLIKSHLVSGEMKVGSEVGLKIDQTLTQDATESSVLTLLMPMASNSRYAIVPVAS